MIFAARTFSFFAILLLLAGGAAHASGGGGGASAHKASDKKEASDTLDRDLTFYVRMDPMVLPVINEKGLAEIVSMLVALEVKDQRTVERVNGMSPKLNDAYVRALYGRIDKNSYRNGKFLDVNKLKTQLVAVTDQVLGKGIVQSVLIQGINQRRFN